MATNYAQKLERERQSPKGNLTRKEAISKKIMTDTGWMRKFATSNIPTPGQVGKKVIDKAKYILGGGKYGENMNKKYEKMLEEAKKWKK